MFIKLKNIFIDRYDNAQRLQEMGLGCRLDPYEFEEKQFIRTINKLLTDEKLKAKLQAASKRILMCDKHEILADKVEHLMKKKMAVSTK